MQDTGMVLDENSLTGLLEVYGSAVTCVGFMGGDAAPGEVCSLAKWVKKQTVTRIKTAWYSGKSILPSEFPLSVFDYIKLGPYIEHLGGLDSENTNQRFYRVENSEMTDMTYLFRKKEPALCGIAFND
jgi:anaerobic ribonucleoside-triphosphate reductase activating protein